MRIATQGRPGGIHTGFLSGDAGFEGQLLPCCLCGSASLREYVLVAPKGRDGPSAVAISSREERGAYLHISHSGPCD